MTTRGTDFIHQQHTTRRRSSIRQALAVISDMPSFTGPIGSPLGVNNINNNDINDRISPWHPSAVAASSPDEMVIQKRGRRSKTIIWSPEANTKRNSLLNYSFGDRTPKKTNDFQSPVVINKHLSIRKRLELSDEFNESQSTMPENKNISLNTQSQYTGNNLANGLKGLSNDQLVKMFMDLISMQENGTLTLDSELREVIMEIMPIADIKPLEDKLHILQRNIYSSLIASNDFDYIRAYIHLDAYQKSVEEQGNTLADSHHWTSLMQYVMAAWTITKELPEFKNGDNTKQKCFAKLINFCKQALLNGNFTDSALELYIIKMENMEKDFNDLRVCLHMAKELLQ